MSDDPTNDSNSAKGASTDVIDVEKASAISGTYKVLGELNDTSGAGVLGRNTADSGTPIGVEGTVPNTVDGVAFAAIQGLHEKLDNKNAALREELAEKDDRIDELEAETEQRDERIEDLEAENEQLRDRLAAVEAHLGLVEADHPTPTDD